MIVAITGATGFIGRRLAEAHLARGDRVRLLTRRPPQGRPPPGQGAEWHEGDLLGPAAALSRFLEGADVLHHCAGEVREPARMDQVNREATLRLLQAAAGRVGRWVQLSSCGVYGPRREGVVTEATPFAPVGPYEVSKAAADLAVLEAHAAGRVPATVLRPANVFGPGMPNASLRQWTRMIRRRLFFFIGPPGALTHYVPVENVVAAHLLCARHAAAPGRAFDLCEDAPIEEFTGWIAAACGVVAPSVRLPLGPVELAAGALGWLPRFPLTRARVAALTSRVRYPQARIEAELGYRPAVPLRAAVEALARAAVEGSG